MTIPAWLEQHLTNIGAWNTDGVNRALRSRRCRCGARTLAGLDDDRCALPARLEPDPLDTAGELLALMQGRCTYRLVHYGGRWEIDRRSSIDIAAQPAGTVDVLVEHRCNAPFPCNGPPITPPPRYAAAYSEEPEF